QHKIYPGALEDFHWQANDLNSSDVNSIRQMPTPEIKSVIVEGDTITVNASGYDSIKWYADGKVIFEGATLDLTAHESKINSYVRAEVVNMSYGVVYTQPFGVCKAGEEREVPVLKSVTQPREVTVPWGNKSEMAFGLPANVPITIEKDGKIVSHWASVVWDVENTGYDPTIRTQEQTFNVKGTLRLYGVVNSDNIPLGVSINVTMEAVVCTDCPPFEALFWAPDLEGKQVEDGNVGIDLGIQLSDPTNSKAEIVGNTIHLTSTSGTYKSMRFHSGGDTAGWNPDLGFAPSPNGDYRAVFDLSVSSGTGSARLQNRVFTDEKLTEANVDNIGTSPKRVTHEWRQKGIESFNIDTRSTPVNVALIISNFKIYKLYRCNGNCDSPDKYTVCDCDACKSGEPPKTTTPSTGTPTPPSTTTSTVSMPTLTTPVKTTSESVTSSDSLTSDTPISTDTSDTSDTSESTFPGTSDTSENTSDITSDDSDTSVSTDTTPETTTLTSESVLTTSAITTTVSTTMSAATTTEVTPPRRLGDVIGNGSVTISDALEVLKYLAKLTSELDNPESLNAALILPASQKSKIPTINDALEILKYLAKLESLVK
ncbi:MAG: hypothetical protein FWF82_03400, partial [Oscillospiraceae bacterium]|nr:hypothetical protein [Oscillospiraceae bacterium]